MIAADPVRGRRIVRGLGLAGIGVGVGMVVAPRFGMRVIGMEAEGRAVPLLAGLFAGRDVALGAGFMALAGDAELDRRWLRVLAGSQISDILLAARLARRGDLSRRGLVGIVGSAFPTFVAAIIADHDLSTPG